MKLATASSFETWRNAARALLYEEVHHRHVLWSENAATPELPGLGMTLAPAAKGKILIPKEFISLAQTVACFRDPERWALLYRVFWRLTHGEEHLLHISVDDDIRRLRLMEKAVRRDIHKMHAFVRFREIKEENRWVAWHSPDHYIVAQAAPFFVRRFGSMTWSLLTPDRSAHWNGEALEFSPGVPREMAPAADDLENLWRVYYASIFNPGRIKISAMKKEMPTRHWPTLPETQLIPELLRTAAARVQTMAAQAPGSAAPFIPDTIDHAALKVAAQACQGCELYGEATQAVFGEGNLNARVVLVGEAPGDQEDRAGHPFVGPAGALLDQALAEAGLPRSELYITNTVKHFRFIWKGKLRFHQKPTGNHMHACRPWLEKELRLMKPQTVVCLGLTAAQAILGKLIRLSDERGVRIADPRFSVIVTTHPAAILRLPTPEMKAQEFLRFVEELRLAVAA